MSASHRRSVDEPLRASPPILQQLISSVILSLFLVRYLIVAESAGQGETLWIVALWFVAAAFWLVAGHRSAIRWNLVDLLVGLLAGGHLVSALLILGTRGDKRTAMNLAWEWAGLFVARFLLSREIRQRPLRRELLLGLIAISLAASGLGLYQHYVDFPQMAAKYGPLFEKFRQADPNQRSAIANELAKDKIPTDGPGMILFEKRLRDSREALGFFALANSFGGFLAVALVILLACVVAVLKSVKSPTLIPDRRVAGALRVAEAPEHRSKTQQIPGLPRSEERPGHTALLFANVVPLIPLLIAGGLLGWGLLLTKSRTAWVGTICGIAVLIFSSGRLKQTRRRLLLGTVPLLISLAVVSVLSAKFGGLDRQVLTEAPKSLQYRLQYWTATIPMIQTHWLFGVGPGQFRWNYLRYKLPEASEEIADPHNLFFDVAANAGIVALVGLIGVLVVVLMNSKPASASEQDQLLASAAPTSSTPKKQTAPTGIGHPYGYVPTIIAGIAGMGWCGLLLTGFDDRLLVLLPLILALCWGLRRYFGNLFEDPRTTRLTARAALATLTIHLLGAGGIGMPAIGLLLLVLVELSVLNDQPADETEKAPSFWRSGPAAGLCAVFPIILYITALRPISIENAQLEAGDRQLEKRKLDAADRSYSLAAAADDFAADPWRRRAELAYSRTEADRFQSNESFLDAVHLLREAKARDPGGYSEDFRLGQWWLAKWKVTGQAADAAASVEEFEQASSKYPTNALLMAELVRAYQAAGESAKSLETARRAIEQDKINHQWNHVDRFLPETTRAELERLIQQVNQE